jgi:hypothetical protein
VTSTGKNISIFFLDWALKRKIIFDNNYQVNLMEIFFGG